MKYRNLQRHSLLLIAFILILSATTVEAQTVRVTGTVTDDDGNPVVGVEVSTTGVASEPGFSAKTNKKGRFSVPAASPGAFDFAVDGYRISYIRFQPLSSASLQAGQTMEAELGPADLPPQITFLRDGRYKITLRVASGSAAAASGFGGTVEGLVDKSADLSGLIKLFEAQDWTTLISEARAVIDKSAESGGASYLLGVALWQSGQVAAAADSMRAAADLIPDQPGINGTLGTLVLSLGTEQRAAGEEQAADESYSEAADLFLAQLEETPDSVVYLTNRVAALDFAGRTDELVGAIEELLQFDAENQSAYLRLAELKMQSGDLAGAFAVFDEMPAGGESAATLIYNASIELWNEGKLEETIAAVDRGIQLAPEMAELYRLKAMALISSDQAQSVQLLEKYIGMVPEDTPGLEADRALAEELKARL